MRTSGAEVRRTEDEDKWRRGVEDRELGQVETRVWRTEERGLGQVETSGGGQRVRTGGDEGMEDRGKRTRTGGDGGMEDRGLGQVETRVWRTEDR